MNRRNAIKAAVAGVASAVGLAKLNNAAKEGRPFIYVLDSMDGLDTFDPKSTSSSQSSSCSSSSIKFDPQTDSLQAIRDHI